MIHLKPNNSNIFYIDETSKSLFEINNFYNIHHDTRYSFSHIRIYAN